MRRLLPAVLLLAGCAIPTTGVVPTAEGFYTVTRQGSGAWVSTLELRAAALQEADQYCVTKKQAIKVIHIKEIPAGPLGRWPEAEVIFGCQQPSSGQ